MRRAVFRRITQSLQWALIAIAIFPIPSAKADTNPIITEPTDFWFSYSEPTQFLARTYQSEGFPSDPQLWLYNNDTGVLLVTNDDYYGLQSNIEINLEAGNYRLRASTCCYQPDVWRKWDDTWNVQYELSFNGNPVNTTTTIPETTTTTEVTTSTSTEAPTTTILTIPPTTTLPEEPTWPPTTESTPPTTTSTTTAPTTTVTVTEPPTPSTAVPTTVVPATTTVPPTTVPVTVPVTSTVVDTVVPSTTPTTIQPATTVDVPQTSAPPTVTSAPPTVTSAPPITTSEPTTTVPEVPTTVVVIPDNPTPEEINQLADELVSSIKELSDEEITNLVESIDVSALTEESISAVFSEEVLNELSDDQVTELIDAIVPSELSDEQASAISEALTDAPDDVKEEFQDQINVFGGQFDGYVPTGSVVSVAARRAIVAATAVIFAMPAPVTRRK